jgi:hypothetical protein
MKNTIQTGISVKLLSIDSIAKSLSLIASLADSDGLGGPRKISWFHFRETLGS